MYVHMYIHTKHVCTYSYIHMYCTGACDNLQSGPFEVRFLNGTSAVNFTINISDDDFYEGDESFNLTIVDNLPDQVFLTEPSRTTVIIRDDEESEQLLLSNLYCYLCASHKHHICT